MKEFKGLKLVKFKNGNIRLSYTNLKQSDITDDLIDDLNNELFFWNDLYINQINGYIYLCDYNTGLVYDFSFCNYTLLCGISNLLTSEIYKGCKFTTFYALSKKESKSLLEDLENGY